MVAWVPESRVDQDLAVEAPRIIALADAPLDGDQAFGDSFNLSYWLSPVYDILRHPPTRTPLTVAVYGSWGSDKTTAMRWLEGLFVHWNRAPGRAAHRLGPGWSRQGPFSELRRQVLSSDNETPHQRSELRPLNRH